MQFSGQKLRIDPQWTTGSIDMLIGDDVGAILVRTDGSVGTLRITGSNLPNGVKDIETGPGITRQLVLVVLRSDQRIIIFDNPSLRMFRRS